jgi:DNA polymerase-3 subunit delta'
MPDETSREARQIAGVPVPEERERVVGHSEILSGILDRVSSNRMPGAVLLHGPEGIGKATLAFQAAQRVFLATGDEPEERIAAQAVSGSYPNLFVLRRTLNESGNFYAAIRVDEVRALRDKLHHTRGRAGHRVAIIDSMDDCNASSANALLKMLEEPPADTMFILVSHRPGGLLPTIRSRCAAYAMRPLPDEAVREVVQATLASSGSELERAVALSEGRPRRAFEALVLGDGSLIDGLQNWLNAPARHPAGARLALADAIAATKDGPEAAFARDMLTNWIAGEAKQAAEQGSGARSRLVSATRLWEKSRKVFSDADIYNLDARQTLTTILDAVHRHAAETARLETE